MRSGISARQGPHQVAQKLSSTTLPRQSAVDMVLPSRSVTLNAGTPTGSRGSAPRRYRPSRPRSGQARCWAPEVKTVRRPKHPRRGRLPASAACSSIFISSRPSPNSAPPPIPRIARKRRRPEAGSSMKLKVAAACGGGRAVSTGWRACSGGTTYKTRLSPVPLDAKMVGNVVRFGVSDSDAGQLKLSVTGTFEGLSSPATVAARSREPEGGRSRPGALLDLKVSPGTSGTISGVRPYGGPGQNSRRADTAFKFTEKAPDGNLWGWLALQENRRLSTISWWRGPLVLFCGREQSCGRDSRRPADTGRTRFTAAQASAGRGVCDQRCAGCHSPDMPRRKQGASARRSQLREAPGADGRRANCMSSFTRRCRLGAADLKPEQAHQRHGVHSAVERREAGRARRSRRRPPRPLAVSPLGSLAGTGGGRRTARGRTGAGRARRRRRKRWSRPGRLPEASLWPVK